MATLELDFAQSVKNSLETHFMGAKVEVGHFFGAQRLNGHMIWEGFSEMDYVDRSQVLRQFLHDQWGDKTNEVSVILTYTPREWELMGED